MSSKIAINVSEEIRKSFTGKSTASAARDKADFKLKKFQSPKNPFSVASMCADGGTVFAATGHRD